MKQKPESKTDIKCSNCNEYLTIEEASDEENTESICFKCHELINSARIKQKPEKEK